MNSPVHGRFREDDDAAVLDRGVPAGGEIHHEAANHVTMSREAQFARATAPTPSRRGPSQLMAVNRDSQLLPIPAIGKPSSSRERRLAGVAANSHYRPEADI